jgi:hypothetical protein
MAPYDYYGIYQAERAKTAAETRAADLRIGELAAAFAQLGSALTWPTRTMGRLLHPGQPANAANRALENREHVRRLLKDKQPQFAAMLESAEQEMACRCSMSPAGNRQLPVVSSQAGSLSRGDGLRRSHGPSSVRSAEAGCRVRGERARQHSCVSTETDDAPAFQPS